MRHLHRGRKLGVDPSHRRALLRSLNLSLVEHEKIVTMPSRAKEMRPISERLVELAKVGDLASIRRIVQILGSTQTENRGKNRMRLVLKKLLLTIAPRFKNRQGGYTQIIQLSERRPGDNAKLCVIQYVPSKDKDEVKAKGKTSKKPAQKTSPKKTKKGEHKAPEDQKVEVAKKGLDEQNLDQSLSEEKTGKKK